MGDSSSFNTPASRKRIAVWIPLAIIAGSVIWASGVFPFRPDPIGTVSLSESAPELDSYVRNESWETGFLSSVPYRKGDVLEFAYFADSNRPFSFGFDWSGLFSRFDLISLTVDSNPVDPSQLLGKTFRTGAKLSLRLRAKSSGSTNSDPSTVPTLKSSNDAVTDAVSSTWTETSSGTATADVSKFSLPVREFSSDTNNAVRILGAPKGFVRNVVIGGNTFKGADLPEGYVFVVDRATFADGDYFVAVHAKDGRLLPLKEKLTFSSDGQSVGVSDVTPSSVPNVRDAYVTLQGRGFSKVVSVQLSNSLVIKNASVKALDDTVAIVRIPAGIPPGDYAMNVMDVNGISSPKRAVVRITK